MKIKESELCSLCNNRDTVEHFFFLCDAVSVLWKEIEKLITKNTGHVLQLNSKIILLGLLPPQANFNKKLASIRSCFSSNVFGKD